MDDQNGSSGFKFDESNQSEDYPSDSDSNEAQVPEEMVSNVLNQNVTMPNDVQVTFPMSNVGCLIPSVDMGQHLMVVSSNGETSTKSLCLEQDGQTFILTGLSLNNPTTQTLIPPNELINPVKHQNEDQKSSETDINQAWFTSREDKTSLQRKGHLWKQGMWSKEEIDLLQENILFYCSEKKIVDPATVIFQMSKDERKDFYRTVAKGLNRPLFSVYRRVIRMYDNKNHVGKYTDEELEQLKELRSIHGNDWQAIGSAMGRSASSIKDRCRLLKENCNQGKWLPIEEKQLAEAVYDLAKVVPGEMISSGLSWAAVAERVGTRSEKQCRTKWLNFLNWKEAGGTLWNREDDISLICKVCGLTVREESLIDWTEMSKNWSSVRSPQWLRGKWWALKRHVPKELHNSFLDTCNYLYQNYARKVCIKEEKGSSTSFVSAASLIEQIKPQPASIISLPPRPILQPSLASTTLKTPTHFLNTMGTTLTPANATNAFVGDLTPLLAAATSTPGTIGLNNVTPVIQTMGMGVLPPNTNSLTPEQAFILSQAGIPVTATVGVGPGQIIIQTIGDPNSLRMNEGAVTLQLNSSPQIIINGGALVANGGGVGCQETLMNMGSHVTTTASGQTQISLDEDKDDDLEDDDDDRAYSEEGTGGGYVESYDDDDASHMDSIHDESDCYVDKGNSMIVSDVMLTASGSPSDIDRDSLDHVPGSSVS